MLREALINLGLIASLFLSVGGLVYLGTTALVAAPLCDVFTKRGKPPIA